MDQNSNLESFRKWAKEVDAKTPSADAQQAAERLKQWQRKERLTDFAALGFLVVFIFVVAGISQLVGSWYVKKQDEASDVEALLTRWSDGVESLRGGEHHATAVGGVMQTRSCVEHESETLADLEKCADRTLSLIAASRPESAAVIALKARAIGLPISQAW